MIFSRSLVLATLLLRSVAAVEESAPKLRRQLGSKKTCDDCLADGGNCFYKLTGQCWSAPACGAGVDDCSAGSGGPPTVYECGTCAYGSGNCLNPASGQCFAMPHGCPAGTIDCDPAEHTCFNTDETGNTPAKGCTEDKPFCMGADYKQVDAWCYGEYCSPCRNTSPTPGYQDLGCPPEKPDCLFEDGTEPTPNYGGEVCGCFGEQPIETVEPSPAPSPAPSPEPSPEPSPAPSPAPSPEPSPAPSPAPTPGPQEYCVSGEIDITTPTNIIEGPLLVDQFDPTLGTLENVEIVQVDGTVKSQANFESLDNTPQEITVSLTGSIVVFLDDGSGWTTELLGYSPSDSFQVGAFDGTIDFGGASGGMLPVTETQQFSSIPGVDAADYGTFIGTGDVEFLLTAITTSTVTGAANIVSQIQSFAGGLVEVCYTYKP